MIGKRKLLLLGPQRPNLVAYLASFGDDIAMTEDPLPNASDILSPMNFIISYGYRHILKTDIISRFSRRIVNLHISLLPWNRGADPNLWSFLEDTPKGVSIHYIDDGIDTGDIVAQREVHYQREDTLRTSYNRLSEGIMTLFQEIWPTLRAGMITAFPQPRGGSFHRLRDKAAYEHLLTKGWDTPVADIIGKAIRRRGMNGQ